MGGDLRVIAGELKGRPLLAPRGWKVRPTSDRVREAIFSALGEAVAGARVLDLYCGTGALAIEALSRGAAQAVLVDRDTRPALGNIESLGLGERAELVRADAGRWLAALAAEPGLRPFDLVFIDAPYRLADRVGKEIEQPSAPTSRRRRAGDRRERRRQPVAGRLPRATAPAPLRGRRRLLLRPARRRLLMERQERHRRLSGKLRPGHERPPRHHHPDLRGLRPGRRRRRQQPDPQAEDPVHRRGAQGVHRGGDRGA